MAIIHIKNNRIIFILIFFFIVSCSRKEEDTHVIYGTKFNNIREKIGLIPLKKNWVHLPIGDDGRIWWYDPAVDSTKIITKAYYSSKMTLIRGDTLISETDAFMSPDIYENDYGKHSVLLIYTYLFVPEEGYPVGWYYYLHSGPNEKYPFRGSISKRQADSILSSWGLSYPARANF